MDAQAGRRSFGDSSSAIQQAELEKNRLAQIADTEAAGRQAAFQQATGNALQDYSIGSAMGMSGAGQLGSLASMQTGLARQALQDQLGAGQQIRGFNQAQLDVANQEIANRRNYGQNQISNLGTFLNAFPTGSSGYTNSGGVSPMNRLGGGLMSLGGGINYFGQQGVNSDLNDLINANASRIF